MKGNRFFSTLLLSLIICSAAVAQKFSYTNADGIEFKFKVESGNQVALISASNKKLTKLEIPSTVDYKGGTYTVVKISRSSLGECDEKLRELKFPNTIETIEKDIFKGKAKMGLAFGLAGAIASANICNADIHALYIGSDIQDIAAGAFTTQEGGLKAYIVELPQYISPAMAEKFGLDKACVQEYWDRKNGVTQNAAPQHQTISEPQPPVAVAPSSKAPLSDVDIDIPQVQASNDNTFAVIFANEDYQEETNVEFAKNDGEMFKTYCHKVLGLPEDNIHFRKNATRNNMIAEMAWLQKVADAYKGQVRVIVYYAGHGVPDEKSGTSYLLPIDGKGTMLETGYSLKTFYEQLGKMPSQGVTVFMDACFSGSKRGDGMLTSARGVVIKARPQAPQGKMVVFSAAQGNETAYPFKEKGHGLFTYYLLKKLKETQGKASLNELGNYVIDQVSRKSIVSNGKSQTPSVSVSQSMGEEWKDLKLR
jgi:hypothetical protein